MDRGRKDCDIYLESSMNTNWLVCEGLEVESAGSLSLILMVELEGSGLTITFNLQKYFRLGAVHE